ncbi:MAG: PaaI family thioesterase [Myxococcota bacterium]
MNDLKMTAEQITELMNSGFPQARAFGMTIESLQSGRITTRLPVQERHLRPGGTVSGPALMTLVDTAFFYLVVAHIGPELLAVTTHLSIDFMRKPPPGEVLAEATLHKLGKRLAVGHVLIRSASDPRPVAQATVTYAIPPAQS